MFQKSLSWKKTQKVIGKPITPNCQLKWDTFYEKQLSGNQFGIYWTKLNVSNSLSSSNGNVCISLSTQNIDYKKWENVQHHFEYRNKH